MAKVLQNHDTRDWQGRTQSLLTGQFGLFQRVLYIKPTINFDRKSNRKKSVSIQSKRNNRDHHWRCSTLTGQTKIDKTVVALLFYVGNEIKTVLVGPV